MVYIYYASIGAHSPMSYVYIEGYQTLGMVCASQTSTEGQQPYTMAYANVVLRAEQRP